jgi:chorismate mutase
MSERIWAVRGAVRAEGNDPEAILDATEQLMQALLERNSLSAERLVSCIFTSTEDLNAEFPAVAARRLGLNSVPLLCAREVAVPGAMDRVIRVLVHYHAETEHTPNHTYLGAAQALRADLHAAQ